MVSLPVSSFCRYRDREAQNFDDFLTGNNQPSSFFFPGQVAGLGNFSRYRTGNSPKFMLIVAAVLATKEMIVSTEQQRPPPPGIPTTVENPHQGIQQVHVLLQNEAMCLAIIHLRPSVLLQIVDHLKSYGLENSRLHSLEKVVIFQEYCGYKTTYNSQLRRHYQHSFRTFTQVIHSLAQILLAYFHDTT